MRPQRVGIAGLAAALCAGAVVAGPATSSSGSPILVRDPAHVVPARLTNLAHLDFLGAEVTPPAQGGHTTYRLTDEPAVGVLWTYAEHQDDGSYTRVGGGTYDKAGDTYGQGAYNADDMARAAVVYLRQWRQSGLESSRHRAYELLRGLTYLQTATGDDAGNVVLWMQPDGTLNRSADPKDDPDPSDSDASYWLARTIWALGEGYADLHRSDPAFGRFLARRLSLAVRALDREVLDDYGHHLQVDGRRTPAWLISDGADASAEAVLGLAAYVRSAGSLGAPAARRSLSRLSRGIAALSAGNARRWPFGAILPWALSRSDWHAWASQMPAGLARASVALHRPRLRRAAVLDSFTFDPWMLTSGGIDGGRLPTPTDTSQIAYGADSRVQSLLATAEATHRPAARRLAGLTAAWFFGANASGEPTYDPATGVTFDGVAPDGTVNANSGAESTIHGLLTMLALDAHPAVAAIARTATVRTSVGTQLVDAEDGRLEGDARVVEPDSLWTGESQLSGTGYVELGDASTDVITLPAHPDALLMPVFDRQPGSTVTPELSAGGRLIGRVATGAVGAQGASPAPGALLPSTLPGVVAADTSTVTVTTRADGDQRARLDSIMVQPLVSVRVLGGGGHGTALLRSVAATAQVRRLVVPGSGVAQIWTYDGRGRLLGHDRQSARSVSVRVVPGGFTLVRR